uniref:Acyl-CoA desaturase delta9 n=1 Tax=Calanus hyperboreus TaxID=114069 RepID=W8PHJ8_CALHY|nr:acyl-CoA desaturase delta9 [Calanus hyperboreus]
MEEINIKPQDGLKEMETEGDSGHASDASDEVLEYAKNVESVELEPYETDIVWQNVAKFVIIHALFFYGATYLPSMSLNMWIFMLISTQISGLGITMGAHRLWAHKTYKAKLPLRIFLTFANSLAGQNSIYIWSRDHRTHHKCSEKMGDPHNAKRGFFFAHMGWLMVRKHPEVTRAGKTVNMTDLENDKLVMLQHKYYITSFLLCGFVIPTVLPYLLWGECLYTAYFMAIFRYVITLHVTWLVNSAAHFFGYKPYDKTIGPTENMLVSLLAMGEGFHNYHHTFPYDYSTSEWGYTFNTTSRIIDAMASIGQAYDLRTASKATIEARSVRTGLPELTAIYQKKAL